MMSLRPRPLTALTIGIFLLVVFVQPSSADTLVMPRELVDVALTNGCTQIDDFYEKPGMVNPPYVYGWIPGPPEDSAVFWCKKTQKSDRQYMLLFKVSDAKQLAGCPAVIEWWNPPRGLSIETRRNLGLRDFRYVTDPRRAGPATVVPNARVIVDYYDGVTSIFYCHAGQWLVASFH